MPFCNQERGKGGPETAFLSGGVIRELADDDALSGDDNREPAFDKALPGADTRKPAPDIALPGIDIREPADGTALPCYINRKPAYEERYTDFFAKKLAGIFSNEKIFHFSLA